MSREEKEEDKRRLLVKHRWSAPICDFLASRPDWLSSAKESAEETEDRMFRFLVRNVPNDVLAKVREIEAFGAKVVKAGKKRRRR